MAIEQRVPLNSAVGKAAANLVEIARSRARLQADELAYVFLDDRAMECSRLTYEELDRCANHVAQEILQQAKPGDRALLVYDTGLDFVVAFLGSLYAGVVAVPIPAPEPGRLHRSLPRLQSVAEDSGASLLLGNTLTLKLLHEIGAASLGSGSIGWMDTSAASETLKPIALPEVPPESLAYLQYTSGSTSQPKGVMISHHNLMVNLLAIQKGMGYDETSVNVCWMPHFHDYGLIEGILEPLFNGTPSYLMSPYDFVKRPVRWLEAISRFRATHTQGPNFAYAHCLRRSTPEQRAGLDLSSLRAAGNAAEPINPQTLTRFVNEFANYGFREESMATAFGLAEVTLIATSSRVGEKPLLGWFDANALAQDRVVAVEEGTEGSRCVASCGRPLPGIEVAIVNAVTGERCDMDRVGEVWIATESVSSGYWNLPEESVETFQACIKGESGSPHLRTGDLGFLRKGQLYIVSRLKDLIIVRGLNHYPQDIEWTVQEASPAFRPGNGAAFGAEIGGEERLVLIQELDAGSYTRSDYEQFFATMTEAVLERHEIAVHAAVLIEAGSLFKTSSGKVQRRAMQVAFMEDSLRTLAKWTNGNVEIPQESGPTMETPVNPDSERIATELITWLRGYAETRINSRLIDERRAVPPPIIMDFGNRGLFGLQVPRAYGGLELSYTDAYRVLQQLGAVDLSLATLVFLHNTNGVLPILWHGSPAHKKTLLPLLASGRELGAFALSEPGAGSNLGGIATRAVKEGSGWKLTGTKRWNGSAWAGVTCVFARDEDASGRRGGLSCFVVRQSDPGIRVGPEALTMGVRGIMQNTLHFEGVSVAADALLGERGGGMRLAQKVLAASRLTTAAVAMGAAQRCAQLMLRYTTRRAIETGTLIDNPQTTRRMSEFSHRTACGLAQLEWCALEQDAGRSVPSEIAMAIKVATTDTLNFGADLLVQLLGGRGYMENNLAPQLFRDARMLSIGEGPNEGLLAAIGRWIRLEDGMSEFLGNRLHDQSTWNAFMTIKSRIMEFQTTGDRAITDLRIRQDGLLGRAAVACLNLHTAALMHAKNGEQREALTWAEGCLQSLAQDVEDEAQRQSATLSRVQLEQRIGNYRLAIGDLEPLAPEVEIELDPLLRREPAVNADLERKRELLRKLLEKEQQGDMQS